MILLYGQVYANGSRWVAETKDGRVAETSFATFSAADHWLQMDDKIRHKHLKDKGEVNGNDIFNGLV